MAVLRPLAYKVHPYKWNTIGKEIRHIEEASMADVRNFFERYYVPGNAILSISGNVSVKEVSRLAEKWFGPIPGKKHPVNKYAPEPRQDAKRVLKVSKKVPSGRLYKAYHCCGRTDPEFYATDLLGDILSKGHSSRLYHSLVREKKIFTEVHAYHTGDLDKSLLVFEGRLVNGVDIEKAEQAINMEVESLKDKAVPEKELTKVKQMMEAMMVCSETKIGHRALNLAFFEMLGDANLYNQQLKMPWLIWKV